MPSESLQVPRLHIADIELPREVKGLYDLAYNLWWTWNPRARELWSADRRRAWALYRNPVQLLINFDRQHWQQKLEDENFRGLYERVMKTFERYLADRRHLVRENLRGLARSRPADRLLLRWSTASTSRCRSTRAVSACSPATTEERQRPRRAARRRRPPLPPRLLPPERSTPTAASSTSIPSTTSHRLPIRPAAGHTGRAVLVSVPLGDREVAVQVWVAQVGRVPLLLLDTDMPQNDPADRPITNILYTPGPRDAARAGARARHRRRARARGAAASSRRSGT